MFVRTVPSLREIRRFRISPLFAIRTNVREIRRFRRPPLFAAVRPCSRTGPMTGHGSGHGATPARRWPSASRCSRPGSLPRRRSRCPGAWPRSSWPGSRASTASPSRSWWETPRQPPRGHPGARCGLDPLKPPRVPTRLLTPPKRLRTPAGGATLPAQRWCRSGRAAAAGGARRRPREEPAGGARRGIARDEHRPASPTAAPFQFHQP
jgi:hypothetical protein